MYCEICNKEFTPHKNVTNPRIRVSHRYCSTKCTKEARKNYNDKYNKKYQQSGKALEAGKKYRKSEKEKETIKKKINSEEYKNSKREYERKLYSQSKKFREKKRKFSNAYYKSEKGKKWKSTYRYNKRNNDPIYKLQETMRRRLNNFLKTKNMKKTNKTFTIIGCTPSFLKEYLEKQFYPNPVSKIKMTWKNHTINGWHIDHKIPLDYANTPEDIEKLSHYTNLQPMWAEQNYKKGNKII